MFISWFPQQNKWLNSGYSTGQWTHDCELWYQARVKQIQDGGGPISQRDWRTKIRKNQHAPKLARQMEKVAAEFIEDQFASRHGAGNGQ